MKKFLSLVLALVMTMSLVTVSAGATDFDDDESITYDEAVSVLSAVNVIDGYTDGTFKPTNTLTRGAAAKIICNLVLGPTTASALSADAAPFSDVPTTNEFAGYIAYCVQQGILDLSLAPTPAEGDSVAEILEAIGVGQCGGPGTTAALAMLNDAVKKGGVMASSSVGGLSGAFIPVSEDAGMIRAAEDGALSIEKLEAMTCVCSVGLDMIAVPGDTTQEAIFGIIADECAIGMINNKTTAVRLIPAIGCQVGDQLDFGGLLGYAPVMPVNPYAGTVFAHRGGRMPAPLNSLKN